MIRILAFGGAFILTLAGVELFRRWSLKRQYLDIPNKRSSHTTPTPRGGGLIIDLVCLFLFLIYCLFYTENAPWAYFLGALLVAFISWLDDLYTISSLWRFLCHSLAAALVIWQIGFWAEIYVPFAGALELGKFGVPITFLWIVWLINAYNFMDGIDGIAGVQALTAGLGWLLIGSLAGLPLVSLLGGVLAFSSVGFLIHNWQPAKIFMGDVGSAFLGFTFAVLPLLARNETMRIEKSLMPVIGVFLVLLFVFDSGITLFKRILRGEKIWQAHRQHIYQRLVISGLSHQKVTLIYGLISIFVLLILFFWTIQTEKPPDFLFLLILILLGCLYAYSYKRSGSQA